MKQKMKKKKHRRDAEVEERPAADEGRKYPMETGLGTVQVTERHMINTVQRLRLRTGDCVIIRGAHAKEIGEAMVASGVIKPIENKNWVVCLPQDTKLQVLPAEVVLDLASRLRAENVVTQEPVEGVTGGGTAGAGEGTK